MTGDKRDCLFFVADQAMGDIVDGFISKGHLDRRLGCRDFRFQFEKDILEAPRLGMGADGGVFKYCHTLLQENGYMESHERLIVMLDKKFGGERPAEEVREEILDRLQVNGWGNDTADVVVIDPELEVWVWQDHPHVQSTLGYRGPGSLRDALREDGEWPDGHDKPLRPKDLFKAVCKRCRTAYNSSLYRDIVEEVSIRRCKDPAFHQLVGTLQRWFPIGGES
ncbi:hypothetical protein Pan97_39020 [Bremerella volcania]|uniref:DUF4276 domain-containing protein n=1 Tax=Bremerella volcania TaxID=2527984 RepID=A0A518CC98_9BACT|nr:hypothetical protein [Bremerella volcania]QDU76845.1 hypothetical protein Pan97_39020 [Bremerella volcania]